jgi:hypothetical protein
MSNRFKGTLNRQQTMRILANDGYIVAMENSQQVRDTHNIIYGTIGQQLFYRLQAESAVKQVEWGRSIEYKIVRAKHWFVKFPADAYAMGPIHFDKPVDVETVRLHARKLHGTRLPFQFTCWPDEGAEACNEKGGGH